jgi:hypothetical protein
MADSDSIGSLYASITADWSDLQDGIDQATQAASAGAESIADAFDITGVGDSITESITGIGDAVDATAGELSGFGEGFDEAVAGISSGADEASNDLAVLAATTTDAANEADSAAGSITDLAGGAGELASALGEAGEAAGTTAPQLGDVSDAAGEAAHGSEEAAGGLGELGESLLALAEGLAIVEGFKEFAEDALEVYGTVQKVTVGLTQLTGSADVANEAIEQIKSLAATQPFAFPELAPTAQRLVALGVTAEQLPDVLQAVANASSATGNSFDAVASALGRINITGQVTARQLVQLGVSWQDLATAMGTSIEDAQARLKKGGQSAAEDMEAVLTAINTKFAGASEAQAQTILGQWTILENRWEEVMESIGAALAPVAEQTITLFESIIPYLQEAIDDFDQLPEPLRNTLVVLAALVPLVAAGALAMGGLAMAFEAASGALAPLAAVLGPVVPLATELAGVFAGPLVAALEATAGSISDLKDKWTALDAEMVNSLIIKGINAGQTLAQLEALGYSANQVKTAIGGIAAGAGSVFTQLAAQTEPPIKALTDLGVSVQDIQNKLKGLEVNGIPVFQMLAASPSIAAFKESIESLGGNFDLIVSRLNQLKTASDTGFSAMNAGIHLVMPGAVDYTDAVNKIGESVADLNSKLTTAQGVLAAETAAYNAHKATLQDVEFAQQAVVKAQNALNSATGQGKTAATAATPAWAAFAKEVQAAGGEANKLATEAAADAQKVTQGFGNINVEPLVQKISQLLEKVNAIGPAGKFVAAELQAALNQLNSIPIPPTIIDLPKELQGIAEDFGTVSVAVANADNGAVKFGGDATAAMKQFETQIKQVPTEAQNVAAIMQQAGLTSVASLNAQINATLNLIEQMEALKNSGQSWTSEYAQDLEALKKHLADLVDQQNNLGVSVTTLHSQTDSWTKDFTNQLNSVSNEIGKLIVQGGTFGKDFLEVVDQIAEKIISTLVDAAFGSLINAITQTTTMTKTLQSLFSSMGLISGAGGGAVNAGITTGPTLAQEAAGEAAQAGSTAASAASAVLERR